MTTRERYEAAVAALCEKLQKDRTVIAAVLFGSLAYDDVWEKSDIDLQIIVEEGVKEASFTLAEEGISIHASLMTRSAFRRAVERTTGGSFLSSLIARSRLLFSKDDALAALWDGAQGPLGARDRQAQLLSAGIGCLPVFTKAEKWLRVKRDYDYAALYILLTALSLARLEIYAAAQNPGREVLQQALKLNPAFFRSIYTDILHGPKDEAQLEAALAAIEGYLEERVELCFGPVLDYLREVGVPRGARELNEHFKAHLGVDAIDLACDWLADIGVLERVPLPLRLTKDSRVTVDEAGYLYVGT